MMRESEASAVSVDQRHVTHFDERSAQSLTQRDRRLSRSRSGWVKSFSCEDVKPLIICRGPIRKETMDVFSEMGIDHYGMLLSEKDSVTYPNALAPELRTLTDPRRVHRVPDSLSTVHLSVC